MILFNRKIQMTKKEKNQSGNMSTKMLNSNLNKRKRIMLELVVVVKQSLNLNSRPALPSRPSYLKG